jgi:hypothetical protein
MTDSIYPAVPNPERRRWTWTISTGIVGIAIAAGVCAGQHQPEPVACEPGSRPVVIIQTTSPMSLHPEVCWPAPR